MVHQASCVLPGQQKGTPQICFSPASTSPTPAAKADKHNWSCRPAPSPQGPDMLLGISPLAAFVPCSTIPHIVNSKLGCGSHAEQSRKISTLTPQHCSKRASSKQLPVVTNAGQTQAVASATLHLTSCFSCCGILCRSLIKLKQHANQTGASRPSEGPRQAAR